VKETTRTVRASDIDQAAQPGFGANPRVPDAEIRAAARALFAKPPVMPFTIQKLTPNAERWSRALRRARIRIP